MSRQQRTNIALLILNLLNSILHHFDFYSDFTALVIASFILVLIIANLFFMLYRYRIAQKTK